MSKTKHADLKKKVIWVCRRMNEMGINQGTSGNVSARTEDGFIITASGIPYDVMDAEHIVEMDLDGGYYGKYLPSTEWRMHMDIFKARPEAGAVPAVAGVGRHRRQCARRCRRCRSGGQEMIRNGSDTPIRVAGRMGP